MESPRSRCLLSHFRDDVVFVSPKAQQFVGRTTLTGKDELRNYWRTALQHIQELTFTIDDVMWDADSRQLLIIYRGRLNGRTSRAAELMSIDMQGLAIRGEALYGVELSGSST